ncbi:hypothetical protein [Nocardioides sp. AX2bis]|uniref:hypothetical protein n=1 Tax=Nocardioides sp. AX2bis TaxID=2653157 RepID=UPI0012F400FF|nr:hypothetical protein [Nocardioides sp. AX2bis]VXC15871.1 conserved hypothetical protein [Nocardioides sp. AX2bis]
MRDEDFIARVRRHKPSALLPLIAQFASTRILSDDWMKNGQRGFGSPWALAEIARVSLAYSNEHRKHATFQDLIACNDAYNELDDPEMVKGFNGPVAGFFLRMCEQLEYQLPARHEMTRALALFKFTEPRRPLRVVRDGWDTELLGVDLVSYIAAGEMLHFAAKPNQGRFNPRWLDQPNFDFIRDVIDPDLLRTAWNRNYVIDASEFAAQNARPRPSIWRRYGHNALLSRPVVRGVHEDWLIPVPGLIVRRLSPLGLYYAGVEHWGKAFADDLGDLFEPYVGSHLRLLGTDVIEPGFTYGRDKHETVDFIVTLPEVIVLVEVKSVRPTAAVRAGNEDAHVELKRMLSKGVKQIERADRLIDEHHPAFAHIPRDRPRVGLLVTLEDFHVLNSAFHRPLLDRERPDFPIGVASAGEIEHWVTVKDVTPGQVILDARAEREEHPWPVGAGVALKQQLYGRKHRQNTIVEKAWSAGPWQQLAARDRDGG